MVDVAAIFSEVFGPDDQDKGVSKKGCARCAGVPEGHKPLENIDNPSTPVGEKRHTLKQGVLNAGTGCAQVIVENQEVTDRDTPTHPAHLISDNLSVLAGTPSATEPDIAPDPDAYEERAAIIHEAHTRTIADDGTPLPAPIFEITREQAEILAAPAPVNGEFEGTPRRFTAATGGRQ